jgi:glucose-1-phosphatase
MSIIHAILFDIGGVILRTEDRAPRAALAARFGLDYAGIDQLVFGSPAALAAEEGRAEPADVWESVRQSLHLTTAQVIDFEKQFFAGDQVDLVLLERIRAYRAFYKTGLLSNAWPKNVLALIYERYRLDKEWVESCFDLAVSSAAAGVRKPDRRIFDYTAAQLSVDPRQIIFVDDFPHNVAGARQAGWQAVHFQSRDQALAEVDALLE